LTLRERNQSPTQEVRSSRFHQQAAQIKPKCNKNWYLHTIVGLKQEKIQVDNTVESSSSAVPDSQSPRPQARHVGSESWRIWFIDDDLRGIHGTWGSWCFVKWEMDGMGADLMPPQPSASFVARINPLSKGAQCLGPDYSVWKFWKEFLEEVLGRSSEKKRHLVPGKDKRAVISEWCAWFGIQFFCVVILSWQFSTAVGYRQGKFLHDHAVKLGRTCTCNRVMLWDQISYVFVSIPFWGFHPTVLCGSLLLNGWCSTAESRGRKHLQLIHLCCRINQKWIFKVTTPVSWLTLPLTMLTWSNNKWISRV
jgi:hypothetical protein